LILAGNDDPMIAPGERTIMHALLPHATLHVYDDGHLRLLTSAAELGPLVSRFLNSLAGGHSGIGQEPIPRRSSGSRDQNYDI
jgi:hypothetical protein